MPKNEKLTPYHELKGSDRLFRYDRDTFIVYTGSEKSDIKPFVRVGAGKTAPVWLLPHIEHAVLPDKDNGNLGKEVEWLDQTVAESGKSLHYAGSREKLNLFAKIAAHPPQARSQKKEEEEAGFTPHAYVKTGQNENLNERAVINFLSNGSFQISVKGSKVMDYERERKLNLSLDKEYEIISKIQSKAPLKASEGYGFVFLPAENCSGEMQIYWNLAGSGLIQNPCFDYHYRFLQENLPLHRIDSVITKDAVSPGFTEILRWKDTQKEAELSVFTNDPEKLSAYKRIWNHVKINVFDDSRILPKSRDVIFFASKTRSHGLFSVKMAEKTDTQIQILFPLTDAAKINRNFDIMRPPFDLELRIVESTSEFKAGTAARLTLTAPARQLPFTRFLGMKTEAGVFPLLQRHEYRFTYTENPQEGFELVLSSLNGTDYDEPVRRLMKSLVNKTADADLYRDACIELLSSKIPSDTVLRANLAEVIRSAAYRVQMHPGLSAQQKKTFSRVMRRFASGGIPYKKYLELENIPLQMRVIFIAGRESYLVAVPAEPPAYPVHLPPDPEMLEDLSGEYRKYLKEFNKFLDKMPSAPAYLRQTAEFLEKLFNDRLKILEDRKKLEGLVHQLEIIRTEPESAFLKVMKFLRIPQGNAERIQAFFRNLSWPAPLKPVIGRLREYLVPFVSRMGVSGKWILAFALILLLGILIWTAAFRSAGSAGIQRDNHLPVENPAGNDQNADQMENPKENNAQTGQDVNEESATVPTEEEDVTAESSLMIRSAVSPEGGKGMFRGARASVNVYPLTEDSSYNNRNSADRMLTHAQQMQIAVPGQIQPDITITGEDTVDVLPAEIFAYADALARRNGFFGLRNPRNLAGDLRNPDLVFPGDQLTLPDGRLVNVQRGETIWKLSTEHYRKDFARLKLLIADSNQIAEYFEKKKKEKQV